jgi:hypothetical protein
LNLAVCIALSLSKSTYKTLQKFAVPSRNLKFWANRKLSNQLRKLPHFHISFKDSQHEAECQDHEVASPILEAGFSSRLSFCSARDNICVIGVGPGNSGEN